MEIGETEEAKIYEPLSDPFEKDAPAEPTPAQPRERELEEVEV